MLFHESNTAVATTVALFSAAVAAFGANPNTDYVTPPFTFSPDHRYGVMIPVWHDEGAQQPDDRMNKVVDLRTHKTVVVIHAFPGYNRALNFHETAPPRWSADSSVLLWKVNGKWFPDALVLLKVEQGREKWQLDLLKSAQNAILERTHKATPERYAAAKNASYSVGSAYPDRLTVDVTPDAENNNRVSLPLRVHVDLTANPKHIENFPANLESHLDAVVTENGKFIVKDFKLGARFHRTKEPRDRLPPYDQDSEERYYGPRSKP